MYQLFSGKIIANVLDYTLKIIHDVYHVFVTLIGVFFYLILNFIKFFLN